MKIQYLDFENHSTEITVEPGTSAIQNSLRQKEREVVNHNFFFQENNDTTSEEVVDSNLFELHIKGRLFNNSETTIYFDKLYRRNKKTIFSTSNEIHYEIFDNALDFYQNLRLDEDITEYQLSTFAESVKKIIFSDKLEFLDNLSFEHNKDEFEIIIVRKSELGEYYVIVGEEDGELSYGFVGKSAGDYDVLHADLDSIKLNHIIDKFLLL